MRVIRPLQPAIDAPACDAIVLALPGWFGDAEGLARCAEAVRLGPGLVVTDGGGVSGFLTYERVSASAYEISWMAVRPVLRGTGIGTQLVERLAADLAGADALLLVKTLSDREDPGPEYSATRSFYLARGFRPMAELDIWGRGNPCQLLGRRIGAAPA